ncbi:hypothetical protein SAMN05444392_11152 [Seinonella peptonophila]|uniref:Uncharacterized protein n=1 Tax=Seinonella peptonophila TaxID=112248 RepID=A0A1M4ZYT9_9BACL|nr:hypothetical protein [Seinonella peptonophila]SHF23134.1 hypothetical protein SAMN05444392_11152 [Seinonella peptonophila]
MEPSKNPLFETDRLREFNSYFNRIREAINLAYDDPVLIKESVERQLQEMEEIWFELEKHLLS